MTMRRAKGVQQGYALRREAVLLLKADEESRFHLAIQENSFAKYAQIALEITVNVSVKIESRFTDTGREGNRTAFRYK